MGWFFAQHNYFGLWVISKFAFIPLLTAAMNISSAPCSGADSAGRNENSINTADCPTSAGLGTPWRRQMLLWILQTPSGRGELSPGAWGAGEGDLGHLDLARTCWIPRKWVRRNLRNKPNLPFLSSGFPEQLQLQLWRTVNGDFRHAFTSGVWGTAWAEDFRTQCSTSVLDDALFSTIVPLCFSCPDQVLHGKIRILIS